jgi:hypothetical protein
MGIMQIRDVYRGQGSLLYPISLYLSSLSRNVASGTRSTSEFSCGNQKEAELSGPVFLGLAATYRQYVINRVLSASMVWSQRPARPCMARP